MCVCYIYIYTYTCMYIYICVYICIYIRYIYIYILTHMYIYIHILALVAGAVWCLKNCDQGFCLMQHMAGKLTTWASIVWGNHGSTWEMFLQTWIVPQSLLILVYEWIVI